MRIFPWLLNPIANWVSLFRTLLFPVTEQNIPITRNVRSLLSAPILIQLGRRSFQHLHFRIILQHIRCKRAQPPEYSRIFLATIPRSRIIVLIIWDSHPGHSISFLTMQMKWACHAFMVVYISAVLISLVWRRVI